MGIVVIGAVFVDIKGYPEDVYIPAGRNVGRVEQVHGGVGRNVAEDIANVELRPTFVSLVDNSGTGADVVQKLKAIKSIRIISVLCRMAWVLGWRYLKMMAMWLHPFPSGPI